MLSGICFKKFCKNKNSGATHLLECPQPKALRTPNAAEDVEPRKLSFLVGGNARCYSHRGRQQQFLTKPNRHTLTSHAPWYLPKGLENIHPHRNLHVDVYSSFVRNCQSLEANKMSFNRWMVKLWYLQTMEYCTALKRNQLSNHEKTWRKLKCMIWRERSRSEKPAYLMVPTVWHSRKGTSVAPGRSLADRGRGRVEWIGRWSTESF